MNTRVRVREREKEFFAVQWKASFRELFSWEKRRSMSVLAHSRSFWKSFCSSLVDELHEFTREALERKVRAVQCNVNGTSWKESACAPTFRKLEKALDSLDINIYVYIYACPSKWIYNEGKFSRIFTRKFRIFFLFSSHLSLSIYFYIYQQLQLLLVLISRDYNCIRNYYQLLTMV